MSRCAECHKTVGRLGDLHECTDGEFKFALAVENDVSGAAQVSVSLPVQYQARGWAAGELLSGDTFTIGLPPDTLRGVTQAVPLKQRGGRFTVSGWLALALVALAAFEAGAIVSLLKHLRQTESPSVYVKAFPKDGIVCDALGTICYVDI